MDINIKVPEHCEPAMVTVVYRFHRGVAELANEHISKPDKPASKKRVTNYGRWTPEQVAYLVEHWGKGDRREVVRHLGFTAKKCSDKYGQEIHRPFGPGAYVYHAPGRQIGRVVTLDERSKTVAVDFGGTTKTFTIDAAMAMHKEMIVRAK